MGTGYCLKDSRWAIPGQGNVAFSITIEREEIALRMECKVVGVAESVSDDLASGQVGLESKDDTGQRLLYR